MTSVEPLSSEFPCLLISVSGPFCAQQSLVWASPYPTQVAASLESSAQGALGGARSLHIPQYPQAHLLWTAPREREKPAEEGALGRGVLDPALL